MTIEEAKEIIGEIKAIDDGLAQYIIGFDKALNMAIASLEAWGEIKQEINDLFSKPACYIPNYDAYKMFLEIIDRHLQEVQDADSN